MHFSCTQLVNSLPSLQNARFHFGKNNTSKFVVEIIFAKYIAVFQIENENKHDNGGRKFITKIILFHL